MTKDQVLDIKATIALSIAEMISKRGLTQEEAAKVLGLSQPFISNLVRGRIEKFTIDRLMRYMRKLDYDVTKPLRPKPKNREKATVLVKGTPVAV